MVKIRYAELSAGLHVTAVARGRDTIVYLLPGLTPQQRQAALAWVRASARVRHGPKIRASDMALAVLADRLRTGARMGRAAMRGHPLLPALSVLLTGAVVLAVMTFVTPSVRSVGHAAGQAMAAPAAAQSGSHGNWGNLRTAQGRQRDGTVRSRSAPPASGRSGQLRTALAATSTGSPRALSASSCLRLSRGPAVWTARCSELAQLLMHGRSDAGRWPSH